MPNQPTVIQPGSPGAAPQASNHQSSKKLSMIILGVIIILLIVFGGWQLWQNHQAKGASNANYKVSSLKTYSLPGYTAKTGMSFLVPSQLQPLTTLKPGQYAQRFLDDHQLSNGKYITVSYEAAGMAYTPPVSPSAESNLQSQINSALTDPSSSNYKSYQNVVDQFVSTNTSTHYNMTYAPFKKLTTPNLQQGAWTMNFSGVDTQPYSKYTPTKLSGQMIYAEHGGGYFYFLVASVNDNFAKNSAFWQQVINSVKIDQ